MTACRRPRRLLDAKHLFGSLHSKARLGAEDPRGFSDAGITLGRQVPLPHEAAFLRAVGDTAAGATASEYRLIW